MTEPTTDQALVDRAYADLLESGDDPDQVASRHGVSIEALQAACSRDGGHEMETHEAGDGVWYQNYGRWCAICGVAEDEEEG